MPFLQPVNNWFWLDNTILVLIYTVESLQSGCWYIRYSSSLAVEENNPKIGSPTKVPPSLSVHLLLWLSPYTLSPTPPSSGMKTPDTQAPGPLASLAESEKTQRTQKGSLMPLSQQLKEISNGICLWLVVQPEYRSSSKKIPVRPSISIGTVW